MGPRLPFSDRLHAMKYRSPHENFRGFVNRFCGALTEGTRHYHSMREIIGGQYFLPAGRVQGGVGSPRDVTLFNCYASGTIADSFVDGDGNIMQRATEAAATMRKGGGDGFDYSPLRPRNALIHKLQSKSSGPVAFMGIWNEICKVTASAGNRRGAMMGVMRIDHPDIMEFLECKQPSQAVQPLWDHVARLPEGPERQQLFAALQHTLNLTGFNISVAVTDAFMEAKEAGRPFELQFGGETYATVDPVALWERVMRGTWDWAEPGVLFIDTINRMNNLWYCETLSATNPCVPGDTPILTDVGWVEISELEGIPTFVWNGAEWSLVTPRVTGEDQPLVRVRLSNGQDLTCTPAHRFVLTDGETRVEAGDLEAGDELLDCEWPVVESGDDIAAAYTAGFFAGDGWTTHKDRRRRLHVISFKRDDKRACIPRLLHRKVSELPSGYAFVYLSDEFGWSKDFVPGAEWSVQSRLDWLAGLIDADGTASWSHDAQGERSSCSVLVSSVDRRFLERVGLLLRTLGVSSSMDIDTRQGEWARSEDCHRLGIKSSMVRRLQDLGLNTSRVDLSENHPRSTNRVRVVVRSVEPAGQADVVYCFTEVGRHMGCFNGVLTGQCGEQPLPPNGACLLGSVNLPAYVRTNPDGSRHLDTDLLESHIPDIVRSMDIIHDVASHPLPEQAEEGRLKRRMGLGVTGEANALEAILGPSYGSHQYLELKDSINALITHECYRASIELAREKGSFPAFDADLYLQGEFIRTLPDDIRDGIRRHGIRNSHLISYAPTGTISLCADNVSSSVEPVFSLDADRVINFEEGPEVVRVQDYGLHKFGVRGKTSDRVSAQEHVDVLCHSYQWVDSAVSKTCNVGPEMPWDEFKGIYQQVWERGGKGCTTFQSGGMRAGVLKAREEAADESEPLACYINPETGERSCE